MPRSLRAFLVLITMAVADVLPGAAQSVDIQPTSVEIPADPGARHRQVLEIRNPSSETLSLTLALADWTLERDGALRLSPAVADSSHAASWARFTPGFVSLEPGASASVIVDMIVPAKPARAGDYRFALMASDVSPGPDGRMRKVETASLFYLTVSPALSAPVVDDVTLRSTPDGAQTLDISLSNSGNAHARLEGEIRIEGTGGTAETYPVSNLVVLEGSERRFALPIRTDLPEKARVSVVLDNLFAPQTESGEQPLRTFTAPLQPAGG